MCIDQTNATELNLSILNKRILEKGKRKIFSLSLSLFVCFFISLKSHVRRACAWVGFSSLTILFDRSDTAISSCHSRTARGDLANSYSCSCVRSTCRGRASWEKTWWIQQIDLKQRIIDGILVLVLIIYERS